MEKTIFLKMSNDRDKKYRIITKIAADETGHYKVYKIAGADEARTHIHTIYHNYECLIKKYADSEIKLAQVSLKENDVLELEYISGKSYEEYIDELLEQGKQKESILAIRKFVDCVCRDRKEGFQETEDFCRVFGENSYSCGWESTWGIDVDSLMSNVIYKDGFWYMYDYEWVFDFEIPVKYMIYRILNYFMTTGKRIGVLKDKIYKEFGITEKEKMIFRSMEDHFQKYIEGPQEGIWKLASRIRGRVVNVNQLYHSYSNKHVQQVFFDRGGGVSENESKTFVQEADGKNRYAYEIDVPDGVAGVRLDPAASACIMRIEAVQDGAGNELTYDTNGRDLGDHMIGFFHNDPQIMIHLPENVRKVSLQYKLVIVDFENEDYAQLIEKRIGTLEQEIDVMKAEKEAYHSAYVQKDKVLEQIFNSKRWKLLSIFRLPRNKEGH